jgi:hypothetical protein
MIQSVKNFFNGLFKQKKIVELQSDNIIKIGFIFDKLSKDIVAELNFPKYESVSNPKLIEDAENYANLFYNVCDENMPLTNLVISCIESGRNKSTEDFLFVDNILFFWKFFVERKMSNSKNDPVIRPTRVFINK